MELHTLSLRREYQDKRVWGMGEGGGFVAVNGVKVTKKC
jgi:hypothetical protein